MGTANILDQLDLSVQEGEFLVFDETFPHEVWNETAQARAVLFIQVLRPMRLRGRLLGKAIIVATTYTKYVQQARRSIGATPIRNRRISPSIGRPVAAN